MKKGINPDFFEVGVFCFGHHAKQAVKLYFCLFMLNLSFSFKPIVYSDSIMRRDLSLIFGEWSQSD